MTKRYLTRASAVVLVAVVLAGCSWRLETSTPEWPAPDSTTRARDAAAEQEHKIVRITGDEEAGGTPVGVVLNEIQSQQAPIRLDALGGVYEAYPDSTPVPQADVLSNLNDAVTQARDRYLADALVTEDADLALLLASAGLSHSLAAWYATWVEDAIGAADHPVVVTRTVPGGALGDDANLAPSDVELPAETLAELAVMHDQARYAYEVMGARAVEDEREQWLTRRDLQAARAQALVSLTGVTDQREATYTLLGDQTADPAARVETAQHIEAGAGATYAALLAETDRSQWPWLLHAAFDAYAQSAAFGEPTVADYSVPALPGIDTN